LQPKHACFDTAPHKFRTPENFTDPPSKNFRNSEKIHMCEIRVDLGREVKPGIFEYSIAQYGIRARSRQPLLDACRQIKRMGGDTAQWQAALYRQNRDKPDMWCSVAWGAAHSVDEEGPRFRKWRPFEMKGSA
jgi:hypothetical protein